MAAMATAMSCILLIYKTVLIGFFSMFFLFCDPTRLFSHKKALSGLSQQQSKSSWLLSGLLWHSGHREFLVREYAVVFLACKPPLVYCMYFTVMGLSCSYRESKCINHQSYWLMLFSFLGELRLENEWANTDSFQSLLNIRCCCYLPWVFPSWYYYKLPGLVCCYFTGIPITNSDY